MRAAVLLAFVIGMASIAPAESVVPGILPVPASQCAWRVGDNPNWAAPSLDESGWMKYVGWKWSSLNPEEPHFWVRCHADLSALSGMAQPAIQVQLLPAYQLFVNGELIGASGDMRSGHFSMNTVRSFPLPRSISQPAIIALRVTFRILGMSPAGMSSDGILRINAGDESALQNLRASIIVKVGHANLPPLVCFEIVGIFGLVFLGLFFHGQSHRELLLLAIFCISAAVFYLDLACRTALVEFSDTTFMVIAGAAVTVLFVTRIWFFFALTGRRVPVFFWILIGLVVPYMGGLAVEAILPLHQSLMVSAFRLHWLAQLSESADAAASFAPFVAFWPYSRMAPRMRPVAVLCMAWGLALVFQHAAIATNFRIVWLPTVNPGWLGISQSIQVITTLCAIAALLWLLFREQRRVSDERAEMAGELQAARHVHQYLIPTSMPETPGFSIATEYRPSREVGGDFFQVLPQAGGDVLIVIGDVAGKGVEAGMLATLIVGAVRTAAAFTTDPARILALLNERLYGRSLVTCLALLVAQDGSATLVNAGHIPPYLNGNELPLDGSLPLGAVPGIQFPVLRFSLDADDSLLLLTDGIGEAQNAHGELFGFDRIAELLRTGADGAAIARSAQAHGQQDDITVLTLTFAPAKVTL